MNFNTLEIHCLNALSDDYENTKTIKIDIDRVLKQDISIQQIENCLADLDQKKLVNVYDFDLATSQYRIADLRPARVAREHELLAGR
jgi:hypothetical protein